MIRKVLIGSVCAALTLSTAGVPLLADTLKLKDGTSLSGRVMDEGTTYWVKDADGQTHTVEKDSVDQWVHGTSAGPTAAAASAASEAGRGQAATVTGGASLRAVKAKADRVDTPIQAVALWQTFLDDKPAPVDAATAKQQLAYWNQMVAGHAERVNGKWIWGAERTKLLKQVHDLMAEAAEDTRSNQTLKGMHEYEQVVKLYPNDFDANFLLGYYGLIQGVNFGRNNVKIDAGVKSLETAVKLRPNCAAALSDLAIGYNFKQKYALSVQTAYQAAKIEDSKGIVQNLVNAFTQAPAGLRQSSKLKPMYDETLILASKYGLGGGGQTEWEWVLPEDTARHKDHKHADGDDDDAAEKGPPGIIGNGTGELISADGYILTNRHVAKEGDYLMVRLADGTMKPADRVVIDDDQDMAVIKIRSDHPLPFVRLAKYDSPPVGEDVAVFGFPLLGIVTSINASVKMTRGIVTAYDGDTPQCDVTIDAQINPGNSGGPIVDHYGNLLAIATAKTFAGIVGDNAPISSYGLGQSSGRLRKFFDKQAAKLAGLHLVAGNEDKELTNEQLAKRMTPVTVVVFICRGERPTTGTPERPPAQP